jgi:Tfp pilus assembly protein PilV
LNRRSLQYGFTLVEVLICSLVVTTGLLSIAGLIGIAVQMHVTARDNARAVRLATRKIEAVSSTTVAGGTAAGGNTDNNAAGYFEQPDSGTIVRWQLSTGPVAHTRLLTVRVVIGPEMKGRRVELATILPRR